MNLVLWENAVYEVVDEFPGAVGEPPQIAIRRYRLDARGTRRYRPSFWVNKSEVQLLA